MSTHPLQSALAKLAELLREWPGRGAIVGGIAVVARSTERFTKDIDVVLEVHDGHAPRLLEVAASLGYTWDAATVEALLPGGLIPLWSPGGEERGLGLDVMFADSEFFHVLLERAALVRFPHVELPVATPEDLVLMKLEAHRGRDIDDVLAIKDAHGTSLDRQYLEQQADRLGLRHHFDLYLGDLWADAAEEPEEPGGAS